MHVEVRGLDQLQQDVLDVLTDIAGLGQRGGVGHRERHVQHPSHRLRQVRLAAPCRADQQDVGLAQLHPVLLGGSPRSRGVLGLDPLVVVVDRHGERLLRRVLPDDVLVEEVPDLLRLGELVEGPGLPRLGEFLLDDLVAQFDALVADVDVRSRDELLDLLLTLPAEGALQQVTGLPDARHGRSSPVA
ncbi:hypothetical protein SDC9_73823 [bioreactor metagenome]|uniref:Uncharacterized protein n=1 Tax=bioreactor metagenome TaxID=1076179 RepID=A0A644YLE6_9ZZZZ